MEEGSSTTKSTYRKLFKDFYSKWWFWFAVVLLIFVFINEYTKDEDVIEDAETEDLYEVYSVGDTVQTEGLEFTLHSVRWSNDDVDEFIELEERWLVIEGEVQNNSANEIVLSSLLMFQLFDEENRSRNMAMFADIEGLLDGEIGPQESISGDLPFKVDRGQERWELMFGSDVLGIQQVIFEITIEDIEKEAG